MGTSHYSCVVSGAVAGIVIVAILVTCPLSELPITPHVVLLLFPHGPISIIRDADFTFANGVTRGNGTPGDPYVIEGWDINASTADGISVSNTTAHFIIRNVTIHIPADYTGITGIRFVNVADGRIQDTKQRGTDLVTASVIVVDTSERVSISRNSIVYGGVKVRHTRDVRVFDNVFDYSGVSAYNSTGGRIFHNDFFPGSGAGASETTNFTWDDGYPSGGNYWYNYAGADSDGDGIGDLPHELWPEEDADRYPLIVPRSRPPIPPVARIWTDPSPEATEMVTISGEYSTDADGTVLQYAWNFGDGTGSDRMTNLHEFALPGDYTVTLAVTDNSGLRNETTTILTVGVPSDPPEAAMVSGPLPPVYSGQPMYFSGEYSYTRRGTITSYHWDFGDGSTGSGMRTSHRFSVPGAYVVTLTVTNSWGVSGSTSESFEIADIPDVPLTLYSRPSGFRLPVPATWDLAENEEVGGFAVDLVLRGPVHDDFMTNIIVLSIPDDSIREDRASMEAFAQSLMSTLRSDRPDLVVIESPIYRTISNHAAVVFAVEFASTSVTQKAAIVASEEHQGAWVLLLSVRTSSFPLYNATVTRMFEAFEITAPPKPPKWVMPLIGFVVAAVVVSVIALLVLRRSKAKAAYGARVAGQGPTFSGPTTFYGAGYCLRCGTVLELRRRFCGNCGAPAGEDEPSVPPPRQGP